MTALLARFQLKERGSTVGRELRGAIATALTMGYILFVNPAILSGAGMPPEVARSLGACTALAAGICCILMGVASNFPIALVRTEGSPSAFANLWPTGTKDELSIDLMRFGPDAPRSAMDYLFIELMLWARAQGYRWFNLGMAPLAGLERHPLAPAWHRVGNFVFRHGEHFYNFEGLRRYKGKFDPVWEPRYLVAPGGVALPRILIDVSVLIAGGMKELFAR